MNSTRERISTYFQSLPNLRTEDMASVRSKLLNGILIAGSIFGLPAVISGSLTAIRDGQFWRIAGFIAAYLTVLTITILRDRIPFNVRAYTLLVIVYALGMSSLLTTGLGGSGRVFLVAFAVITTVLFGIVQGLIAIGISLVSMALVAWGISAEFVEIGPGVMASSQVGSWITGAAVFAVMTMMLVASLGILQRSLENSVVGQNDLVDQLREEQLKLEDHVAQRTRDLRHQTLQLQTAAEIAKMAASEVDPQDLMARTVELICDRFDYYNASIYLLDDGGAWAELVAGRGQVGRRMLARHYRLGVGSASLIGWVTSHKETKVIPEAKTDPFHLENPLLPDTHSEMGVPLVLADQLIGVLDVQSIEPQAFSDADIEALEVIGNEIAITIENQRLRESQAAQLDLIPEQAILEKPPSQSWEKLIRGGLKPNLHIGSLDGAEQSDFLSADMTLRSGQIAVIEDGREVAVPVRVRGEIVATIAARKPRGNEKWSEEDIALLTAVAGQAALALETARQYEEEQRRVAELEAVNRISQASSQLLRPESLFSIVRSQIVEVLGPTDMIVALYDPETQTIQFPYAHQSGHVAKLGPESLEDNLTSSVIRSGQSVLLSDNKRIENISHVRGTSDNLPASWLGVPMLSGETVLGAIILKDDERMDRFSEEDAALLTTIAGQVSTSLQNLSLLEEIQSSARRERLIHEISTKVRRSSDIQSVLETATREVGRALNAARSSVKIGNPSLEDHSDEETIPGNEAQAASRNDPMTPSDEEDGQ